MLQVFFVLFTSVFVTQSIYRLCFRKVCLFLERQIYNSEGDSIFSFYHIALALIVIFHIPMLMFVISFINKAII